MSLTQLGARHTIKFVINNSGVLFRPTVCETQATK